MSATTKQLDYGSVPPRASSSRAIRNEIVPSNGQTFNMNNTIIIDFPANLNNTFCDFHSSYLSFNIANTNTTANQSIKFETGGAPSIIRRLTLEIGGQTLASIENYNILYQMMFDMDAADQFRDNAGEVMFGAGKGFNGATLDDTAGAGASSRKVCFPLVVTPLMCQKYFPLIGRERLRLRLDLDDVDRAFIHETTGGNATTNAQVEITDVKMVTYSLELGSDVMSAVAAASGGVFKMAMPNYQNHQSALSTSDSKLVATLGFSMSSLNRLLVAHTRSTINDVAASVGNRARAGLQRASVSIGGVKYPMRDIRENSEGSEVMAEALLSQRALTSWGHQSALNSSDGGFALDEGDGIATGSKGLYLLEIDLESQRVGGSPESQLIAGVNTIGQICQLELTYDGTPTNAYDVNVFAEYTTLLMLDLNSLVYSIAV